MTPRKKPIGTIYEGKIVWVQAVGIENKTGERIETAYLDITVPSGVEFYEARIPYGSFSQDKMRWTFTIPAATSGITAEFGFTITNDCLSSFEFNFDLSSPADCTSCAEEKKDCVLLEGYACCDFTACGFSIVNVGSEDLDCPESPVAPVNPPANPVESEYYFEVFNTCEAWWKYENGSWVLLNTPAAPEGSVSTIANTIAGNPIAVHDNGAIQTTINETITQITNVIAGGHQICIYVDEAGNNRAVRETVCTLVNNGDGTYTFTNENGDTVDFFTSSRSPIREEFSDYIVTNADGTILANTGCTSITLPDATTNEGKIFRIKELKSSGFTTVDTVVGNIDGQVAFVFSSQYESITVQSNGLNYLIV